MTRTLLLLLALALDWLFGEPSNELHPVAWYGNIMRKLIQRAPRKNPRQEFLYGAGVVASGIVVAGLPALLLEKFSARKNIFARAASLLFLKTMFAQRALLEAGDGVREALAREDLEGARFAL